MDWLNWVSKYVDEKQGIQARLGSGLVLDGW